MTNYINNLNRDELIFDGLVVVSSIIVQKLMFYGIMNPKNMSPAMLVILGAVFVFSLSFMMGTYLKKYDNEYNEAKKGALPKYMAVLIFPGILFMGIGFAHSIDLGKYAIFYIAALMIVAVIAGRKTEDSYMDFKEIVQKAVLYFSAVALSFIETFIIMLNLSLKKHSEADTVFTIIGLFVMGYIPYRLLIAFSPPVNKRNLIFALLAIVITVIYFIIY